MYRPLSLSQGAAVNSPTFRCERRDSNPQARNGHQILSLACLPIPPLSHTIPKTTCGVKISPVVETGFEPWRDRTSDPQIKSLLLYQLS
jgi:hypothetical protein